MTKTMKLNLFESVTSVSNIRHQVFSVLLLACAWVVAPANAQDLGQTEIQLVSGDTFKATIASVDEQGQVKGEGVKPGILIQDILSIKTDRTTSETAAAVVVVPAGGGRIQASRVTIASESVQVKGSLGEHKLPLQSVRAIVWSQSDTVKKAIASPSKDNDQVIVQVPSGERVVEGILESIDNQYLNVNYKGESRPIALEKIKAVVIADLGLKKPEGAEASVKTTDGSQFKGSLKSLLNGKLSLSLAGGAEVEVDASKMVSVNVLSDKLLFLSDTEPVEIREKPLFAIQLPWQKDRSVEKNPLRLRGASSGGTVEFKKGIGVQSFSQLRFANTRDFDRFAATIGIDVETAGRGDCRMVVEGDGIELWSKRVTASDEPESIEVDITGMKQVSLIVYPGAEFDLGDHADWAEARFVKTK